MFRKISLMMHALTPSMSAALNQHAGEDRCDSNGKVIETIAASDEHRNDGGPGGRTENGLVGRPRETAYRYVTCSLCLPPTSAATLSLDSQRSVWVV